MLPISFFLGLLLLLGRAVAGTNGDTLGQILASNENLTTFYGLIQQYPDVLLELPNYGGITVVAPSNAAFKNIPYTALNHVWDPKNKAATVPLLQYHILNGTVAMGALQVGPTYVQSTMLTSPLYTNVTSGQNVVIDKQPGDVVVFTTSMGTRCTLVETDMPFQDGLVQVIDNLLIPPAALSNTSQAFQLPSFLGALYAAGMMPQTAYEKNVTIFAPSDGAIDSVGGSLENMTAASLRRVLSYHIVPGRVLVSSSLQNGTVLQTEALDPSGQQPESLLVRQAGNNLYVNSAQVIQPNILIANGILHIISNVLNPDAPAASPNPAIYSQAPVFPVSEVANAFTSDLPCSTDCPVTTTPTSSPSTTSTVATALFTSSSDGAATPARCTARVAGAALGALGVGAGMAWI